MNTKPFFFEKVPFILQILLMLSIPPLFVPLYFYPSFKGTKLQRIIYFILLSVFAGLINLLINRTILKG
jgi:hypothetical protein